MHIDLDKAKFFGHFTDGEFFVSGVTCSPRVAGLLVGRSPASIRDAISSGTLPASSEGRHQRIDVAALAKWADRSDFSLDDWRRVARRIKREGAE